MDGRTLRYADIMLEPVGLGEMIEYGTDDTGIQYDYFDSVAPKDGDCLAEPYKIINQTGTVGYVALYHIDITNGTADIYGRISEKRYYSDFIKAFLALLRHAFTERKIEKLCLVYKGIKFPVQIFDPSSGFDCLLCGKQEISVPEGRYTDLLLVATAQFGDRQAYITAVYEDGTSEECRFDVGDWCNKIVRDEHIIHYAAACRNLGWKSNMVKCDAFVYLQRVRINSYKGLKKLIFPMEDSEIFIFAGALCEG